ncbi:unnamed protein product, partial [Medioppia subpectinata]
SGRHLGGVTSGGLGFTDYGDKSAIIGLAKDFYHRIGVKYGKTTETYTFEPHVAEVVYNSYITEANVSVLFDYRIISAKIVDKKVESIVVEKSSDSKISTNVVITAKMFIDCSYEGDLMSRANISYTFGRESNSLYNETHNGVQMLSGHQFPDGIDPYVIPGNKSSGLLWGISDETLARQGSGDKKIQSFNYRICLTNNKTNRIDITKPDNYNPQHFQLLIRLIEKLKPKSIRGFVIQSPMPNQKTDINNYGPFSTDAIAMNYEYPDGSYETRKKIVKQHEDYTKGFLYFVGHDPQVPQHLRDEMLTWGYPKDEYKDNNHWTHQLYIRESRRMSGQYLMTERNAMGKDVVSDGIAMASYTMDSHNAQRVVVNGMVKNEGNVESPVPHPYPVSYGSVVPKSSDCHNVLVPVCLSATHIAYGSIRMEYTFMELGEASAVAAVMALEANTSVQELKKLVVSFGYNEVLDETVLDIQVVDEFDHKLKAQHSFIVGTDR